MRLHVSFAAATVPGAIVRRYPQRGDALQASRLFEKH